MRIPPPGQPGSAPPDPMAALQLRLSQRRSLWGGPVDAAVRQMAGDAEVDRRTAGLAGLTALDCLERAGGPRQGLKAWLKGTADRASRHFPAAEAGRAGFLAVSLRGMERYARDAGIPTSHFSEGLRQGGALWGRMQVERYQRALVEAWRELDFEDGHEAPPGEIRREADRVRIGDVDLPVR